MQVDKTASPETRPASGSIHTQARQYSRLALVVTGIAYFVVGKLGLEFAFLHASASAIWPATGLAISSLLLGGLRLWPAISVAAFLVNITTTGALVSSALIAGGNTLEALAGAMLVRRYAHGRHAFDRAGDVVKFWFLACMLATLISATIGVGSLCVTRVASWANFGPLWRTWWLGDATGGFVASALILLWARDPHLDLDRRRFLESSLVFAATGVVTWLVFRDVLPGRSFYVLPILLWSAFRLGRRETAGVILLLAIIGSWCTLEGRGPFASPLTAPNEALLLFQSYLAVLAVTNLTVASVVRERRNAVRRLRVAHDDLERRVHERTVMLSTANSALREEIAERRLAEERFRLLLELAPDAMVIVNSLGRIEIVNTQAEKLFGYRREELIGKPVEMLVPEEKRLEHRAHRSDYSDDPHARPMGQGLQLHGVRRDGTEFPVEVALSPIQIDDQQVICAAIRDQTEQKALEERVMAAERERGDSMRELAAFVQGAQEEERRRVSRELHDDLGQRLAALKLGMQVFEQELARTSEPYRARLQTLVSDVDRMIAEVRRLSYNLRPLALDDFGLTVALEMLCREFERVYKLQTRLHVSDALPAFRDPQVDIALYRIAQGALSNVARHAGARNVSVSLSENNGRAVLVIEDDGRGFDVKSLRHRRDGRPGLGLIGMRERAEMLGGSFHIVSDTYKGTRVEAQIPVSSGAADSHANR